MASEYAEDMASKLIAEDDYAAIAELIAHSACNTQVIKMAMREGPYIGQLRKDVMYNLLLDHCEAGLVALYDSETERWNDSLRDDAVEDCA